MQQTLLTENSWIDNNSHVLFLRFLAWDKFLVAQLRCFPVQAFQGLEKLVVGMRLHP